MPTATHQRRKLVTTTTTADPPRGGFLRPNSLSVKTAAYLTAFWHNSWQSEVQIFTPDIYTHTHKSNNNIIIHCCCCITRDLSLFFFLSFLYNNILYCLFLLILFVSFSSPYQYNNNIIIIKLYCRHSHTRSPFAHITIICAVSHNIICDIIHTHANISTRRPPDLPKSHTLRYYRIRHIRYLPINYFPTLILCVHCKPPNSVYQLILILTVWTSSSSGIFTSDSLTTSFRSAVLFQYLYAGPRKREVCLHNVRATRIL